MNESSYVKKMNVILVIAVSKVNESSNLEEISVRLVIAVLKVKELELEAEGSDEDGEEIDGVRAESEETEKNAMETEQTSMAEERGQVEKFSV